MLLFSFCVPQHFHADVNEALIKRFGDRFFRLWLRIGRTDRPRGSMEVTAGTGGVAAHQGQIQGIPRNICGGAVFAQLRHFTNPICGSRVVL
jgi:hypothetical protein